MTDKTDNPYLEKFIVTLTPDPRQEADDMMYYYRMCGCNPWSMTISRVSSIDFLRLSLGKKILISPLGERMQLAIQCSTQRE